MLARKYNFLHLLGHLNEVLVDYGLGLERAKTLKLKKSPDLIFTKLARM